MIYHVGGNLLNYADRVDALVNPVNCEGVSGKGLALAFAKAYKQSQRTYELACKQGKLKPGEVLSLPGGLLGPKIIMYAATKDKWAGLSRLPWVEDCINGLIEEVARLKITSIAVPALGCGLGGLRWDSVRQRLVLAFEHDARMDSVSIYLFPPESG